ncbi:MAG: FAD-binding oxidoreductase [Acidimicrobiia bacterium]
MKDLAALAEVLAGRLGPGAVVTGADAAGRLVGWAQPVPLGTSLLVRPATTEEVLATVIACREAGVGVVPLGGGTGLVGGAVGGPDVVALSLERLDRVLEVDADDRVLIAEAGVTLETAQRAAAAEGLDLGLDLGARSTAQLGGLVATNAGGNGVIRHGMTRHRVLGLEVVLADGTVLAGLRRIVKDNTGYDLAGLFCGSEGTLGVVTAVALRCSPTPAGRVTALVAVPGFDETVSLLRSLQARTAGAVAAFEVMWRSFYELVAVESGHHQPPLPADHPLYVLTEVEVGEPAGATEWFAGLVAELAAEGAVADAVVAHTAGDRAALWAIRDDIPALVDALGGRLAYDVSLPIAAMPGYLEQLGDALAARHRGSRLVVFGHLGDGNLHVTIGGPPEDAAADIDRLVYEPLAELGGSISAEHGIGRHKRPHLARSRSPEEIATMRAIKQALDPTGILNPGALFE